MISCLKCRALLDTASLNTSWFTACPRCNAPNQAWIFPSALADTPKTVESRDLIIEDDAGCFYHPSKQAVVTCGFCGRFLCALCDIDMEGNHICFTCMAAGKEKKTLVPLENYRMLYDALAVRLAIFPVIFFWFITFMTAPVAIFLSIRHWHSPSSIVPRKKKLWFIIAIILSLIQVAGWGVLVFFIMGKKWS